MTTKERRDRDFSDPASDAGALLLRLGVIVLAILIPCVSVISRRPLFVLTPIGMLLVIIGSRLEPMRRTRTIPRLCRACLSPLGLATLLFVVWAGLSLAWTPFPALATDRFLKTAGTVLLAVFAMGSLPNRVRVSNANLLPIGVAAAALAIIAVAIVAPAIARAEEVDTNTIHRALIGVVVLVWPALGALAIRERMALAGAIAIVVAAAAVAVWLPSALTALILAILTFTSGFSNPARTGKVLGWVSGALIFAAPVFPLIVTFALGGRILANGMLDVFPEWAGIIKSDGLHLLTGHGFDTSVRAYALGRFDAHAPQGLLFELWYELGVIGAGAAAALSYLAFSIAGRASHSSAPFLLAARTCVVALGSAGQAIAQLWWLTLICIAAVSFALVIRSQHHLGRVSASVVGAAGTGLNTPIANQPPL